MDGRAPVWQRFFAELKRRKVFRVMAVYGIVGWAVLQAMDLAVPALLLPEWTYRLVAVLLLSGFPVAIVLAWAFEIGPEGVRLTAAAKPGELEEIVAAPRSRRWPSGLLALAGISALLAGAWYAGRATAPAATAAAAGADSPPTPSIAVLPCLNASSDPEQEYFSDGIASELSGLLSRIPGLRVTSFTSSLAFKARSGLGARAIADSLDVDHVLDCSVQKAGGRVRIAWQLVNARTDATVWDSTWNRTEGDVFTIQDEIAADVARQLQVRLLGPLPRAVRADTSAYNLLLEARHSPVDLSPEGLARSVERLRRVVRADSSYAVAHAELAWALYLQTEWSASPTEEAYRSASQEAYRALAIDPDLAFAHATLGAIASAGYDLQAFAGQMNQALAADPSDLRILVLTGQLLRDLGRPEEAIRVLEYVAARDPLTPWAHTRLAFAYAGAGRYEDALATWKKGRELRSDPAPLGYVAALFLIGSGAPDDALRILLAHPDGAMRTVGLARAYQALGRDRESDEALARFIACCDRWGAIQIAGVFAARGDADGTFDWLDKAVENLDPGVAEIGASRTFDALEGDPRWIPFLEGLGLAPEQLDDIEVKLPPLDAG
jgi:adenylate cyclase